MRVLVACEESQTVCKAFRAKGHEAFSCDVLPCSGGHPEWHYRENVLKLLQNTKWDLMIAHPPCTYILNSGIRWLYKDGKRFLDDGTENPVDHIRWSRMEYGAQFFKQLLNWPGIPLKVLENPRMAIHALKIIGRESDQIINPWEYGHMEQKETHLWLVGCPPPNSDKKRQDGNAPASEKRAGENSLPVPRKRPRENQKRNLFGYRGGNGRPMGLSRHPSQGRAMKRTAVISSCGFYRYSLTREWETGSGTVNFVMLNPSTADGTQDDPTILRCIAFAQSWGFKKLIVTNIYGFRATNPKSLRLVANAAGPENGVYRSKASSEADQIIWAWGSQGWKLSELGLETKIRADEKTFHLGLTKGGYPKHPLYLRSDTERIPVPVTPDVAKEKE